MSLSRQRERERRARQQREDFRAGLLRDLAEAGPDYPIKTQFLFNPDFFPLGGTRYEASALGGEDKNPSLPAHQI